MKILYQLENDIEDELILELENISNNVEFEKELPPQICFKITGQKDKHSEIEVTVPQHTHI